MAEEFKCKRCGQKRPALGYAPIPTELGQRIGAEICQPCWAEWLAKQNMLINHYGLDLTSPEKALEVYSKLKSAGHLSVGVERNGQKVTKDYSIR